MGHDEQPRAISGTGMVVPGQSIQEIATSKASADIAVAPKPGVVHAWVGWFLLICNSIKRFCAVRGEVRAGASGHAITQPELHDDTPCSR